MKDYEVTHFLRGSVPLKVAFEVLNVHIRSGVSFPLTGDQEGAPSYRSGAVSDAMFPPCSLHDDHGLTLWNCEQPPG